MSAPQVDEPSTIAGLHARAHALVAQAITRLGGSEDVAFTLTRAASPEMGDLALPCFTLRGQLTALDERARSNPQAVASALADALADAPLFERVEATRGYLNLALDTQTVFRVVVGEVHAAGEGFGGGQAARPEKVVVEFSAPNTNKPQHLGHVRNNLLGEAVSRCLAHHGHEVVKVNLINDRGIHICKSMLAYQRWGDGVTPATAGDAGAHPALTARMLAQGIWQADDFADGVGKKGDHLIGDFYVLFEKAFAQEYEDWRASDAGQAALAAWLEGEAGRRALAARAGWEAAAAAAAGSDDEASTKKKKKGKKLREPPRPDALFWKEGRDDYFNQHSELGRSARQLLLDWEAGEPAVRDLWRRLNRWVIEGFDATYARMGVSFERVYYESETYTLGKALIDEGLASGVFDRREDGAVVFDLASIGLSGEKVMLRSDGTSVYITQDLGTAMARYDDPAQRPYRFDRMIYVVGSEQAYHFQVLFGALGALRDALKGRCEHLSYGMVGLPKGMGRMKSREGTAVDADDLMDSMRDLMRDEIAAKADTKHYAHVSAAEKARRAEVIGQAALKYFLLDVTAKSAMTFDPRKSIEPTGRTGVYCLYNYARTQSLLREAGGRPAYAPGKLAPLGTPQERQLAVALMDWPRAVEWAATERDPAKIADALFGLCKALAVIFSDAQGHPVATCPDPALREARLLLVAALGDALAVGLRLLGIALLDEM